MDNPIIKGIGCQDGMRSGSLCSNPDRLLNYSRERSSWALCRISGKGKARICAQYLLMKGALTGETRQFCPHSFIGN
jgi:hypothetical protein